MKKLTMELDSLAVQSFETGELAPADRGTVQAREAGAVPTPSQIDHTFCTCPGLCQKTIVDPNLTAVVY